MAWKQTYSYDRFGNRSGFYQKIGNQELPIDNHSNPQIDQTTNRFAASQGYTYDKNGNIITDADGRQFVFNGENKQTEVRDANNNVIGQYFYDGEGKRVKKVTATETVTFVYSGGKLVAEYSSQPPPSNPTTLYTATDPLGSPRVITNAQGAVVSRRDFMPFGEELLPEGVYRKTDNNYTYGDTIRQRFTGYQKDEETKLDFAEARMYNNAHGRFTAVDPLLASGKSANPQTFNRYVYVMNRPLIMIDPTGETGDFYDKKGIWLFTDYENDDKVYAVGSVTTDSDGTTRYDDIVDLTETTGVTHTQFKAISGVVSQEGRSDDTNEYLWIAHASNNDASATNRSLYRAVMSGLSTVPIKTRTAMGDVIDRWRCQGYQLFQSRLHYLQRIIA